MKDNPSQIIATCSLCGQRVEAVATKERGPGEGPLEFKLRPCMACIGKCAQNALAAYHATQMMGKKQFGKKGRTGL